MVNIRLIDDTNPAQQSDAYINSEKPGFINPGSPQIPSTSGKLAAKLSSHIHDIRNMRMEDLEKKTNQFSTDEYKFFRFCVGNISKSYSQVLQDLWVMYETDAYNDEVVVDRFFVEFGATNGIDSSNTYALYNHFQWRGLLAEPAKVWIEDLKNNRPEDMIIQTAIAGKAGTDLPFLITQDPVLSTIKEYQNSDYNSNSRQSNVTETTVNAITLEELLRKAKLQNGGIPDKIDYVSIDTEGSEYDILKDFPFDKFNITLFTIEHNFTSQRDKIYELMVKNGYERKFPDFSLWDDWYRKT